MNRLFISFFLVFGFLFFHSALAADNRAVLLPAQGWCYAFSHNLASGARGGEVNALQRVLIANEIIVNDVEKEDSSFGVTTKSGLQKLQKKLGVSSTGFFGPLTRSTLNSQQNCREKSISSLVHSSDERLYSFLSLRRPTRYTVALESGLLDVRWKVENMNTSDDFRFDFLENGSDRMVLGFISYSDACDAVGECSAFFKVPANTTAMKRYQVRVTNLPSNVFDSIHQQSSQVSVLSDDFYVLPPFEVGRLHIVSPFAHDVWKIGTTQRIVFTPSTDPVLSVEVRRGGVVIHTFLSPTLNSIDWTLPTTLAVGDDYTVRVIGQRSSHDSSVFSVRQ